MRILTALAPTVLGLFAATPGAIAQSADFMKNECSSVGQTYFRDFNAPTDMQYNGQRVDGTHAINGRIYLETRYEDFACSYDRAGRRIVRFVAQGREQNAFLPGAGGQPAGGGQIARVTGAGSQGVEVRSGPANSYPVTGALANGDRVRVLGCHKDGTANWCQIEMMTDMRERGWMRKRFLEETAATAPGGGTATQLPASPPTTAGPGIVQVTGVSANDVLNVRSGPGTQYRMVGALSNGTSVRNLGCQAVGSARWCQIEMLTEMRMRGWVNGRYLTAGTAAQLPSPPSTAGSGGTSTERVRFVPGTTGATLQATLAPGASRRYLLGARSGQLFTFQLTAFGPTMSYQIFNPDGSFLLDQVPAGQVYRGELWQSGDHVVEVINRSNMPQTYTAVFNVR